MKKDFKYKVSFSTQVKPLVSKEVDKYLSLAADVSFKKFLPKDIDFNEKIDFLGFAGEAFIANRLNLNEAGVDSTEAIRIANLFPLSFVDVDHKRDNICGVIVNSSYAEFGTGKELSLEDVKKTKSPFSVVIGGIIWRVPNPKFAEAVEESSDPNSEYHNKFFLSWELLFSEMDLIVIDKNKYNFEDGVRISDEAEIKKLENKLRNFGGSGFTDDGKKIGMVIKNDSIPVAVGIVESPAANVLPIDIKSDKTKITIKSSENDGNTTLIPASKEDIEFLNKNNLKNSQNSNSQLKNVDVKTSNKNNINKIMLKSLKDLNDEVLKEATASEIVKAHKIDMDTEIEKISNEWETKKNKVDVELKASSDKLADLQSKFDAGQTKLNEITENLNKLVKANSDREQEEIFNTRMNYFDAEYDLSEEKIRNIVARKIKGTDEKTYNEAKEEIELLLAAKKKSGKVFDPKTKKWVTQEEMDKMHEEMKTTKTAKASTEEKTEDTNTQEVVDKAIDNGEKTKTTVAATTTPTETQADKWAKAFGEEGWELDKRSFRK